MGASNYDVAIIGGGCAGLSAAIGLAKAGFAVVVLEAAPFPGAENWSGCVYFCENLAHPSLLGPETVEELAWERRLVQRGIFASNGHTLLGLTYRDAAAFRHCYTVLRPIFDHHLAQLAMQAGVVILNNTTAESLIRVSEKTDGDGVNRIVGVATNRGPVYADLTFLAEGDASHLVTREGYERISETHKEPRFLHGIKQVIDLPPEAVEENFGLQEGEGAAYEILLRNGTLRGQNARLNMGGFVYTNRRSLSIGLVLPAENLHNHFGGDPNLLIEWFENLPDVRRWCKGGTRGVFGAKLIRGGGARDIPHLIDHGLAIGGAASSIGVDFPYPNFTGPATRMGLQIVEAVKAIRQAGGSFTKDELNQHYLEPLRKTHYWQDVEFLRRWPGYVERTHFFFSRNIDLILGTAYIWTRPSRWLPAKWLHWVRMLMPTVGPGHWGDYLEDIRGLGRALRVDEVVGRPRLGRLFLDGWMNALRDIFGQKRKRVPSAGRIQLVYSVGGGEPTGLPPKSARRWFSRFTPVLAAAAQRIYANDETPLRQKLGAAAELLIQQINILDLIFVMMAGLMAAATGIGMLAMGRLRKFLHATLRLPSAQSAVAGRRGIYAEFLKTGRETLDFTPHASPAAQKWEGRLGQLAYLSDKRSHIRVFWPDRLEHKAEIVKAGLWHVCPAHVYEARVSPQNQVQLVVNFENCIKCETCWRTSDLVDWGRDGRQRFIYPVCSPATERLLAAIPAAGGAPPALPRPFDFWIGNGEALASTPPAPPSEGGEILVFLVRLLDKLRRKLEQVDEALTAEPRTADRARTEQLERLSRYAQQLAEDFVQRLREIQASGGIPARQDVHNILTPLSSALVAKLGEMVQHVAERKFSWAAADGRQIRQHHLEGLRRLFEISESNQAQDESPELAWLHAERDRERGQRTGTWWKLLDQAFPPHVWRDLERQKKLTPEQEETLKQLVAAIPPVDPSDLRRTLHPPIRKAILAELGRRDPSLAYRIANHLWARDLGTLATAHSPWQSRLEHWRKGEKWAAFTVVADGRIADGLAYGEAIFVPAADDTLLLIENQLILLPTGKDGRRAGLKQTPAETLGLRGAELQQLVLDQVALPETHAAIDRDRVLRIWHVLSAADLTSIASGMADQLTRRCVDHAAGRVQFPGLFHDEQARDTIGKFGAVKKMLAEMAAHRQLIETLDQNLTPTDFSKSTADRWALIKAQVAECLGTSPGSVTYNAGQIFGGTGFSEDDILSKYYRDASAWRFLGPSNPEIWREQGRRLLHEWQADGRGLAGLELEAELFDQVIQRKALQAELDELRVLRTRLRAQVGEWLWKEDAARPRRDSFSYQIQETWLTEMLARQDAHLLASKALLLRTHARMEQGMDAETELALLRVWLGHVKSSLAQFGDGFAALKQPVVEATESPSTAAICRTYDQFLQADAPYDSGDFLRYPATLSQSRLVPEMIHSDPALSEVDRRWQSLVFKHFGEKDLDGRPYEYYVERRHRPDDEDLDYCRRNGFFRLIIPQTFGGEGLRKLDYYLLTRQAQRLADVSVSLTIQVNTSLGTTPIFVAREKDLPKARKDLAPFIGDTAIQKEISDSLGHLLELMNPVEPKQLQKKVTELNSRLEETVFSRPVLRSLTHAFAEAWSQAKQSAENFDFSRSQLHLIDAVEKWNEACGKAPELLEELPRRLEAYELALRWIASGQISAFALTEPSAGSDTARLTTRAKLRSVPVETDADGAFYFIPVGGREPRYLLDARRLEFRPGGVFYRWSDDAEPSLISFAEYDYETDDPGRTRFYYHGGRRINFTDIAQIRERDGRLWYDYWELNGAKMWITNGRMMGIMVLYAKTAEGVTAFVVDRHAEGLLIGKDEEKMGQRGSPTNELALQNVRVPRENVLGLEGRGQVNALETLNIGRAGIAMTATALMETLVDACRQTGGDNPRRSLQDQWRVERMEEQRFIAESVVFEVIGRLDHKQTKAFRMESAIAKMLATELWHSNIELAEEILGLPGQTHRHCVEKRKRDARVLNIYEGTNEVQRFSILRELAEMGGVVSGEWSSTTHHSPLTSHHSPYARRMHPSFAGFHQRLQAAQETLGTTLWQNPNFQAGAFLLAEAAAWLKAMDSVAARLGWLAASKPGKGVDPDSVESVLAVGRRAFQRCAGEISRRLVQFDQTAALWRHGKYAPEIHAAEMLFRQSSQETAVAGHSVAGLSKGEITRPLCVLVILEVESGGGPHPVVQNGRLLEPYHALTEASRAALETALKLRDGSENVAIKVAMVGSKALIPILREVLALGVESALLVLAAGVWTHPEEAAAALAHHLKSRREFYDLILCAGGKFNAQDGLLGQVAGQLMGLRFSGSCVGIHVVWSETNNVTLLLDSDGGRRVTLLPAAIAIQSGLGAPGLRPFDIAGYLRGLTKPIHLEPWPGNVAADPVYWLAVEASTPDEEKTAATAMAPEEAAHWLRGELGIQAGDGDLPAIPDLLIKDVELPRALQGVAALAVVAADAKGNLSGAALSILRAVAGLAAADDSAAVLLLTPDNDAAQQQAVAALVELGLFRVVIWPLKQTSAEVRALALAECWPSLSWHPQTVLGENWTETAFVRINLTSKQDGKLILRAKRLVSDGSNCRVETVRSAGMLRTARTLALTPGGCHWISCGGEFEWAGIAASPAVMSKPTPRVERWRPRFRPQPGAGIEMTSLLGELKAEAGVVRLADAEFIIDVGFGVGNRDGYEEVIEPLEKALRELGVRNLSVGGSRKVTEELHLLPADRQIGQSGGNVNPRILLAVGISGAPQHLDYIGTRATIVAFNRDAEAPIMTLNQRRPRPRVIPVVGDLFETVPALTAALLDDAKNSTSSRDEIQ